MSKRLCNNNKLERENDKIAWSDDDDHFGSDEYNELDDTLPSACIHEDGGRYAIFQETTVEEIQKANNFVMKKIKRSGSAKSIGGADILTQTEACKVANKESNGNVFFKY